MGRNLMVCLDGTRNEPETGATNVVRIYEMAVKDSAQLVYYDPGVGTMGARSAITRAGQAMTRAAGLVAGYGVKDNIAEAYRWLMGNFRPGDQIFLFGFSRGAYTALALAGMLRTVGLLRPGADNLVPYALKLYTQHGPDHPDQASDKEYWRIRDDFSTQFGNPEFPGRFAPQIAFLGLWDTVKSVGWLNARARYEQARWPFTRIVTNVATGRLALAIDENRRPYAEYRFDPGEVAKHPSRLCEMWFAGVHSDIGGQFRDDHKLSDIALGWMTGEATTAGLRIDEPTYEKLLGSPPGTSLQPDAHSKVHTNSPWWVLAGFGWHHRTVRPGDHIHPSVRQLIEVTRHGPHPYRPHVGALA